MCYRFGIQGYWFGLHICISWKICRVFNDSYTNTNNIYEKFYFYVNYSVGINPGIWRGIVCYRPLYLGLFKADLRFRFPIILVWLILHIGSETSTLQSDLLIIFSCSANHLSSERASNHSALISSSFHLVYY